MARGAISKEKITKKILETFEGSFLYNGGKEIRIPVEEDGEVIQIKVALTAAKVSVEPGDENALPTAAPKVTVDDNKIDFTAPAKDTVVEPTAQEKANVSEMLRSLGL